MKPQPSFPSIGRRAWKVWMRNRDVFLKTYKVNFLPPFLEPLLYLFALGFGLGIFIQVMDGVPYARFIAPSLIAISVMNTSFFECTYASYVRIYFQKTVDAILATPLNLGEFITGELLWAATKSSINAAAMLVVISLFRLVESPLALLIIPFSFLAGFLFASIAMCFTAIVPNIDALNYPIFLLVTPMLLFSGTFFPISVLPQPIQYLSIAFLPLVHVVNVSRALTLGQLGEGAAFSFIWIAAATALLFVLSIKLMMKRLVV